MPCHRKLGFLAAHHIPKCQEDFRKTYEDYFTIQYCAANRLTLTIDDQQMTVFAGQMWSMRPPRSMWMRPAAPGESWDHRYVAFRGGLAQEWMAEGLLPSSPRFVPSSMDVADAMDRVIALVHSSDRWSILRAINTLESLMIEIRQRSSLELHAESVWFPKAVSVLCEFNAWPVDYQRLARTLGMSVATLRRRFHQATGMSAHHYAMGARIAEAKRLLTDSQDSVQRIADTLGYRDIQYFSKQFRQVVGIPPTTYRMSFRPGRTATTRVHDTIVTRR